MSCEPTSNAAPSEGIPPERASLVQALRDACPARTMGESRTERSAPPTSEVAEFAQSMLEAGKATRCVGTSCRMNGANVFHRELEEAVQGSCPEFAWVNTGCLARCGHGPNLRVGRLIYRGRENWVETDTRTWVP